MSKIRLPTQILFFIHDLNPWGGQDKVTLELIRGLPKSLNISVHAYSLQDTNPNFLIENSHIKFNQMCRLFRRPVFLKSFYYHCRTNLIYLKKRLTDQDVLFFSAGACFLFSDIIHVHFIHKSWNKTQKKIGIKNEQDDLISKIYHQALEYYDLLTERISFSSEKLYITVSHKVANELKECFPEVKNIQVIYPGIDLKVFKPTTEKLTIRENFIREIFKEDFNFLILFVGSYERKGLSSLLEAFSLLPESTKTQTRLLVIGKGDRTHYVSKAKNLNILNKIGFIDPVKELTPYYQSSDLFVLPTQYEPFGMVILESMACGTPVLVSEIAGAAELIHPGLHGDLIKNPNDALEISNKIHHLFSSEETLKKMSENSRQRAAEFSWQRMADEHLSCIEKKLMQKGQA